MCSSEGKVSGNRYRRKIKRKFVKKNIEYTFVMEEWRLKPRLEKWAKEEIFLLGSYIMLQKCDKIGKPRNIEFVIDYPLIKNIPENLSVCHTKRREIQGNMIFGRLLRGMLMPFKILIILWCRRDKASIHQYFEWFDGHGICTILVLFCSSQVSKRKPTYKRTAALPSNTF